MTVYARRQSTLTAGPVETPSRPSASNTWLAQAAPAPADTTRLADMPGAIPRRAEEVESTLQTEYTNSPDAQEALGTLTEDANFSSLPEEQRVRLLDRFSEAPNAAQAEFVGGMAEFGAIMAQPSEGVGGFFTKLRDGLNAYIDSATPDGGSMTVDGVDYQIDNGQLMDAEGNSAGRVYNNGQYRIGEGEARSYYDDIHTRVRLTEGEGEEERELLNLHSFDRGGHLSGENMNDEFVDLATDTARAMRRENINARFTSGFRSFQEQQRLYDRRDGTTQAQGGQSWHNYGLAADIALVDDNGQPHWNTAGDDGRRWQRYGELAQEQGLEWGGSWRNFVDMPHIEYHPDHDAGDAGGFIGTHRQGGLEAVWDRMGIGEQP